MLYYSRTSIIQISIIWTLDYPNNILISKSQKTIQLSTKLSNKWNASISLDYLGLLYHSTVDQVCWQIVNTYTSKNSALPFDAKCETTSYCKGFIAL